MAEGTPMAMVMIEKAKAEYGLMPLMNMWWPQTMKPSRPIDRMADTMALYPKMGLRENTETNSEHNPIARRIASSPPGCPKNHNICCHKSAEPPQSAASRPLPPPSGTNQLRPA